VPSFQPSGGFPGNVPQSSGFLFNAQADAGLIYGAGANYTAAYGMYDADKNGGWQSFGGMAGGPTGAYSIVDPKSASQIPLILGGAVSVSGGAWFSNAATRQDLMGHFSSFGVITPWGSSSYSTDGSGIYVITVTVGFPPGAAVTSYPTDTKRFGGR